MLRILRGSEFESDYTFMSRRGMEKFKLASWDDHLKTTVKARQILDINARRGPTLLAGLRMFRVLLPVEGGADEMQINPEWVYDQGVIDGIAALPSDRRSLSAIISAVYRTGTVHRKTYSTIHDLSANMVSIMMGEMAHAGKKSIRVVDLFGGDGQFMELLRRKFLDLPLGEHRPHVEYVVVDYNQEQVRAAQRRFRNTDVKVISSDLLHANLPGEVQGADIILSIGGGFSVQVSTRTEAEALLERVYRALAPHGYLYVSGLSANHFNSRDYRRQGFQMLHASFPFSIISNPSLTDFYLLGKNSTIAVEGSSQAGLADWNAADEAMVGKDRDLGGIDLTLEKALTVENNGRGIKFHIDPAMLKRFQDAPGFTPVVINIQPMTDIRLFLGLSADPKTRITSI